MKKSNYCIKHSEVAGKIITVIDIEIESIIERIRPLFDYSNRSTKIELRDYIVNDDGEATVYDKNFKPKDSWALKNISKEKYHVDPTGTLMIREFINPQKMNFRIINSKDDLETAKVFNPKAKLGDVITSNNKRSFFGFDVIPKAEFEAYYTILN